MRGMIRVVCVAAMLASPIAAAAQGTNAFDGTYRGVSLTVDKYGGAVARCVRAVRSAGVNLKARHSTLCRIAGRAGRNVAGGRQTTDRVPTKSGEK